ncbi:hypothetical protein BDN71DRAFT_1189597 [Pleurotus eryngii]|uniref:Uncharacterized protein n=1 Tax=Pleurotus eryngii TaxID=5323 RepID=A0A9P6A6X2_PLEER|nr:hypothetical protein BDN71DRAFT_1189597 [Pleurotus eryngii]
MLTNGDSDDSSFFKPASSSTEHTHFTPQSFTHLTVWAYIAIGVIVVITSSVLCYAIYSCYQPLRDGNAIVIGETGFVYPPEHRDKERKRRPWLAFLKRHRNVQEDKLSAQEIAEVPLGKDGRTTLTRPAPAHLQDVPHIRVHSPPLSPPPNAFRDSQSSTSTAGNSTLTGTTATSDIWSNPKLSPVTGPVLLLTRVSTE